MASERHLRPAPRERTFAAVFPWRNLRRAAALVILIAAIVMIKRSLGPMLDHVTRTWGGGATAVPVGVTTAPVAPAAAPAPGSFGVHLGPGLAPPARAAEP